MAGTRSYNIFAVFSAYAGRGVFDLVDLFLGKIKLFINFSVSDRISKPNSRSYHETKTLKRARLN